MTGMLRYTMNQPGKLLVTTTDEFGDQNTSSETSIMCRFRYITDIDKNVNREALGSEAMIWLSPDLTVSEGNIIFVDGGYWRIQKLVKARKMSGTTIEFYKAFVTRHTL